MSLESQSGPLKSMKSLLPTQIFLQKRCFAPETRLVHQWGDGNLAKFDRTVVTLESDAAWLAFIGVVRHRGQTIDDALFNHLLAVEHHRDLAADQTDVVSFPFTGRLAGVFTRCNAAIKGAGAVSVRRAAVVIQDLHFIAIPQRDPAVAVLGQAELDMQLEIPELLLGHDVLTTARGGQRTIFHRPTDRFLAVPRHPAGHILAVEQFNWLSFSPSPVI